MNRAEWIRLPQLIEELVSAQLAVLHNGKITDAAAGVLNTETGAVAALRRAAERV